MSYRTLWIVAFSIEAMLMVIGLVFIGDDGSLSAGIAWILTQMPSHAISNWIIAEHFVSNAPFFILTFVLQGTLFGSVLSIFKWVKTKLDSGPAPEKKEPIQPPVPTRGNGP